MAFIKLAKIRCIYKVLLFIAGCKGTIFPDKTSKFPSYSRASVIFFVHIGQTRQIIKYLTDTRCASIRVGKKRRPKSVENVMGFKKTL